MSKIFAFCNACHKIGRTEHHAGLAMSEDGHVLAQHMSSNHDWLQYDLGINSERNHDKYNKHYPNGWEIIFLDSHEAMDANQELQVALEKHLTNITSP